MPVRSDHRVCVCSFQASLTPRHSLVAAQPEGGRAGVKGGRKAVARSGMRSTLDACRHAWKIGAEGWTFAVRPGHPAHHHSAGVPPAIAAPVGLSFPHGYFAWLVLSSARDRGVRGIAGASPGSLGRRAVPLKGGRRSMPEIIISIAIVVVGCIARGGHRFGEWVVWCVLACRAKQGDVPKVARELARRSAG